MAVELYSLNQTVLIKKIVFFIHIILDLWLGGLSPPGKTLYNNKKQTLVVGSENFIE